MFSRFHKFFLLSILIAVIASTSVLAAQMQGPALKQFIQNYNNMAVKDDLQDTPIGRLPTSLKLNNSGSFAYKLTDDTFISGSGDNNNGRLSSIQVMGQIKDEMTLLFMLHTCIYAIQGWTPAFSKEEAGKILYDLGLTNTDVFLKMVEAGEYDKEFVYKGLTYGLGYGGVLGLFTFTIDLP